MKKIVVMLLIVQSLFAINLEETLSNVILENEYGSFLNGDKWSSIEMDAPANVVFYVDPDFKDLNDAFGEELQKLKHKNKNFKVFVIINMAATWIPNVLIDQVLETKQENFPEAIYIKDNKKVLVNQWGIDDDNSDIVLLNRQGEVEFYHSGKMTPELCDVAIKTINILSKSKIN